jgi:hypothetical protein
MIQPCKGPVNKILEKNEVKLEDLVVGEKYLLEYYQYHINKTLKFYGEYIRDEMLISPYVTTYFKTDKWIHPLMIHETLTRYYTPVSDKIKQNSLERQAFAQSINKLVIGRTNEENKKAWRSIPNKNGLGYDLVKMYYN